MAITLGDRISARINYGMEGGALLPKEEGVVVYIHPEGRFYTLEFTFPGPEGPQRFRESYIMAPPPERIAPPPPGARFQGHHNRQAGALGKWLANL